MAATPKPIRKEAKKLSLMLRKVDKSHPALKAETKSIPKKHNKAFTKFTAEARLKGRPMKHSKEDLSKAHAHMKKHGG